MKPAAIVLDRDGVLNELWFEPELGLVDSPLNPSQLRLRPGAAAAVRRINAAGVPCHVASNQPGVAKGKMTVRVLRLVTDRLVEDLAEQGARLDGIAYCLHHPDAVVPRLRRACPNRKPGPGLLLGIARSLAVPPQECWFVGDNPTDVEAGRAAGFRTAWIGKARCDNCPTLYAARPDLIATDLEEAVTTILKEDFHAAVS